MIVDYYFVSRRDQIWGCIIPGKGTLRLIPFLVFLPVKFSPAVWPKDDKQDHLLRPKTRSMLCKYLFFLLLFFLWAFRDTQTSAKDENSTSESLLIQSSESGELNNISEQSRWVLCYQALVGIQRGRIYSRWMDGWMDVSGPETANSESCEGG